MIKEITTVQELNDVVSQATEGQSVLLQFSAEWCGPCKAMIPVIDKVSEENENIIVLKTNVDIAELELTSSFGVRSVPTFFILDVEDGKPKNKLLGVQSYEKLVEKSLG